MSDPIHGGDCNQTTDLDYSTPNYKLPLWKQSTVTSWMSQMNYAMATIDTVMHNLALRTSIDGSVPPELFSTVEQLEKDVAALKDVALRMTQAETNITNLQTQMANVIQDVNTLRINFNNIDTRMTTAESAIQNLQADVDRIQQNVNTNSTDIADLKQRVAALEASG